MKIYILREDYKEVIDPEGFFDEEEGEYIPETIHRNNIIGVYADMEDAVRKIAKEEHKERRKEFILTEVDTECVDEDGNMGSRLVKPEEYKENYFRISADLYAWRVEDFEKFDKEFEDKDWFNACCKDCQFKQFNLGSKIGFGRCVALYEMKKAETNCGKVKRWLEENKK